VSSSKTIPKTTIEQSGEFKGFPGLQTTDRWSGSPHIPTGPVPPRASCTTARELNCTQKKLTFLLVYSN